MKNVWRAHVPETMERTKKFAAVGKWAIVSEENAASTTSVWGLKTHLNAAEKPQTANEENAASTTSVWGPKTHLDAAGKPQTARQGAVLTVSVAKGNWTAAATKALRASPSQLS